ncbi:MAG: integrase [Hyphomicrobiales bacterium]|nr:MAG: integrase [Hyphomicrobiales bacterium]
MAPVLATKLSAASKGSRAVVGVSATGSSKPSTCSAANTGRRASEETGIGLGAVAVVGRDGDLLVEDDVSGFLALTDLRAGLGPLLVGAFAFARISAVVTMRVEDYYPQGKRWWVRLHEKGGKRHEMPAHHNLEAYLDAYIQAAGLQDQSKSPLFRSAVGRTGALTATPMNRIDAYRMIQRRAADMGMKIKIGCHTFRATAITAYLEAGGSLENAQAMAAHESPRTTKLYDRTGDEITLDDVERITI